MALLLLCGAASTQPASRPAALPARAQPTITRMVVEGASAAYWLVRPAGHGPDQRPALLIVLHGTDDAARDMIEFWRERQARVPLLIVAPESVGRGWREQDVPNLRAVLADLRARVPHDPRRVLLAGFSAGGAMAFHLLYVESFPVTAVAGLANYVPPQITDEQIQARRRVPIYYAVGMEDVNHERMRVGVDRLRSAGADVELYRPRLGHVLSADVAQGALDWLLARADRDTLQYIDSCAAAERVTGMAALQQLLAQRRWYEPQEVAAAEKAMQKLEAPGRRELAEARGRIAAGQPVDAVAALVEIERRYAGGGIAREAAELRTELLKDPAIQRVWQERTARRRADEAMAKYAHAQRLVADQNFAEAADVCRTILEQYAGTTSQPAPPATERARFLLNLLEAPPDAEQAVSALQSRPSP